jgi:hypothetical protein
MTMIFSLWFWMLTSALCMNLSMAISVEEPLSSGKMLAVELMVSDKIQSIWWWPGM